MEQSILDIVLGCSRSPPHQEQIEQLVTDCPIAVSRQIHNLSIEEGFKY